MQLEHHTSMSDLRERARSEVAKVVVGQGDAVEMLLVGAIAHGHVLVEGPPGSAKTLLANAVARVLGVQFKRIQFTPDTTPTEILGAVTRNALGEQVFAPGVIFTNVLLADEINRTPPMTQASLLEAMQERLVTIGGKRYPLPDPFLVIATQNPFEHAGIFPLAESQLDRFLFKIDLDYVSADEELEMLRLPHIGVAPDLLGEVTPLLGPVALDRARVELDATDVADEVARYLVSVVRKTRTHPGVELGASSRAAMHLLSAAKATARLSGRSYVLAEDVAEMAPFVLRHRLVLDGSTTPDEVLRDAIAP